MISKNKKLKKYLNLNVGKEVSEIVHLEDSRGNVYGFGLKFTDGSELGVLSMEDETHRDSTVLRFELIDENGEEV